MGKIGLKPIIVCQNTFVSYPPNMDVYTWSEYEWLMMEVNTLWLRVRADVSDVDKRVNIIFCQFYNHDFMDNVVLGWHRQTSVCPEYDAAIYD